MNKIVLFISFFVSATTFAQFAPEPGETGTTAIRKDSSCFVAWADNGTIYRGFIDINDTTATYDGSNRATFGELSYAFGPAQGTIGNVVSLGDSGFITLTFPQLIIDGPGFDFAIFENGFMDHYMEFGHVEVSSDGVHFFRFPSTSNIALEEQISNSATSDCALVNNLAGKYRIGYGTPFDLADVPDNVLLNKQQVTHVRVVDAIGAITGTGTTDQFGTTINDPYPTPFASSGFDIDAIGIINGLVGLPELEAIARLYPNPATDLLHIELLHPGNVSLRTTDGKIVWENAVEMQETIDLKTIGLSAGMYQLQVISESGISVQPVILR